MRLEDTVVIEAPVGTVWGLTVDVEGWPRIAPTFERIERLDEGPLRIGSRATVKQPGQRETVWTVSRIDENERFTWGARVFGVWLVASHVLAPDPSGGVRNTLTIDLAGPAASLLGLAIGRQIRASLKKENAGFKAAAEAA
jgi:uncharacterized membrane protein